MRSNALVLATAMAAAIAANAIWLATSGWNAREVSSPAATISISPAAKKSEPIWKQAPPQTQAAPAVAQASFPGRTGEVPQDLMARHFIVPVLGVKKEALQPAFYDARGQRGHEAIDIMAARGTPVVAVEDGAIAKLFASVPGGITLYQFDPTGTYAYYYAHLDHYAEGLKEGDLVRRGQIIAYVGSTGNANVSNPHLHFAIFRLGPEKRWWKGEPLDPYPLLTAP